ncbi:GntR family transcriptional regulator [Streptomyces lydicus]|nr:GntR family transcriptional regulator [Streptomyces lydicus]
MQSVRKGRVSLVESATDEIRAQIVSGAWPVGSRIPPESALSETLGVSRASVREAVRSLVHAGLLEPRQGDGTFVLCDDDSALALRRRLERAELSHVTQVRQGLDVVAARQAAQHRTDRQLAGIEAALARRGPPSPRRTARPSPPPTPSSTSWSPRRVTTRPRRHLPLPERRPARGTAPRRLPGHRHRGSRRPALPPHRRHPRPGSPGRRGRRGPAPGRSRSGPGASGGD